jgi:predicted CXXCH cytochrome family protein
VALADQARVTGTEHDLGTPDGVSSCETCHIPHATSDGVIWQDGPDEEGPLSGLASLCYSCHDGTVAGGSYAFDEAFGQHPMDRETGEDCNMCHDPHISDYGSFLLFPSGANLCQACHEHASEADHPVNRSVHEVEFAPVDIERDPEHGDLRGARLWDANGRPGDEYTKCLTCHAAHAGSGESLLATDADDLLGVASGFCLNCHQREVQ